MKEVVNQFERIEAKFLKWTATYSIIFLRVSIGTIYVLFGALKFFPNYSPAEPLAIDTIEVLSFGLLAGNSALLSLAVFETVLGLSVIFNYRLRLIIYLTIGHMLGTFLPLIFFPEQVFTTFPLSLSLVGQYIIKNFIIVGALLVLYSKSAKGNTKVIVMDSSEGTGISDDQQEDIHALLQEEQQRRRSVPVN